jgi:hypothetical protein
VGECPRVRAPVSGAGYRPSLPPQAPTGSAVHGEPLPPFGGRPCGAPLRLPWSTRTTPRSQWLCACFPLAVAEHPPVKVVGFFDVVHAPQLVVALEHCLHVVIQEVGGGRDVAVALQEVLVHPEGAQEVGVG